VTERPILFKDEMVRAIMDGRKTVTRRVLKNQSMVDPKTGRLHDDGITKAMWRKVRKAMPESFGASFFNPYGQPKDRLWVREAWSYIQSGYNIIYRADHKADWDPKWRPSIHMFRKDSRIDLEIIKVSVERLQKISQQDAIAEGCTHMRPRPTAEEIRAMNVKPMDTDWVPEIKNFIDLWDSINLYEAPWSSNPWVWRVEFRRIQ